MVMKIYLEVLSSGMKARLDPAARLSARQKPSYMFYTGRDNISPLQPGYSFSTGRWRKPATDLLIGAAGYRKPI